MLLRLLLLAGLAFSELRAEIKPSSFYIISEFFSDNGPLFYYRLIEVQPDGPNSVVRYVRIAPRNVYCPRMMIQAVEGRAKGKSPAELVGRNNPCAVEPSKLRSALRKFYRQGAVFETISFGIVAQCGPSSVSLALPHVESVDLERMKTLYPDIVRLWDLSSQVTGLMFGPKDIFQNRSESDDFALQRADRNRTASI